MLFVLIIKVSKQLWELFNEEFAILVLVVISESVNVTISIVTSPLILEILKTLESFYASMGVNELILNCIFINLILVVVFKESYLFIVRYLTPHIRFIFNVLVILFKAILESVVLCILWGHNDQSAKM